MPTTTIRLDKTLKSRLAAAAQNAGTSPHAFILDAIARTVEQAEQDTALQHLAETRWATIAATGATIPWDEARTWLEARTRNEHPEKPTPRPLTA